MPIDRTRDLANRELEVKLLTELRNRPDGATVDALHPAVNERLEVKVARPDVARALDRMRLNREVTAQEPLAGTTTRVWRISESDPLRRLTVQLAINAGLQDDDVIVRDLVEWILADGRHVVMQALSAVSPR